MQQTLATLLRVINAGEADRLLVFYTEAEGKKTVRGRGMRKIKSKLAGHVGLFIVSDITYVRGREIDTLTAASIIDNYQPVGWPALNVGYVILELMNNLTREGSVDQKVWDLFNETLAALKTSANPQWLETQFSLRLLSLLGWQLRLERCVHCRQMVNTTALSIDVLHGGLLCPNCINDPQHIQKVSPETVTCLQRIGYNNECFVPDNLTVVDELTSLAHILTELHSERELRTRAFMYN